MSLFLVYNDMLFFLVFNTLSLQNFKRGGIRCRVLSSVSLFLVYNDVLFFLVFDYISFFVFSQRSLSPMVCSNARTERSERPTRLREVQ